ncbi:type VI secretion protein [Streptomyces cinnamoneus]|uniref:type VI secretion protein n=1 Tax=Streptomyces cinnamoneus TaxID=53446 RepID=UPI003F565A6C
MRDREPPPERGIPDGLLLTVISFLLGLTLLVWTATGLSALLAHGAWPEGVSLTRTPPALRHLMTQPRDLPAAWPETPVEALSGYGLFWGILISEVLVAVVLTTFAIGTVARWRAVRARQRSRSATAAAADAAGWAGGVRPVAVTSPETATPPPAPVQTEVQAQGPIPAQPQAQVQAQAETPAATPVPAQTQAQTPAQAQAPAPGPAPSPAPAAIPAQAQNVAASAAPAPPSAPIPTPAPAPSPTPARQRLVYTTDRRDPATRAVLDASGPVLVVTSDPGLWAGTKTARAKLGPVLVFDPVHLLDTPDRLRWNPTNGCESRGTAAARAAALLAPVRPPSALDSATADTAETLLRCWLHAAAVDGRPFRQVHRWAQGTSAHEPVRILRTHPRATGGTAGELESALTGHPERRDMAQALTARALGALTSVHIRDACNPNRANSPSWESFIAEGGTLYVVGEAIEDPRTRPGAMPLLTALASSVVEHGRRMAERSSSGRLDPPLALVLDDVAAVAPLPALPELLEGGEAQGLPTLALMRSEEQARARWPRRPLPAG